MTQSAVYLQAHACVCALGDTPEAIRAALWSDAPSGVAPTDRHTPGRVLNLGCVTAPLPSVDRLPPTHRSRNNALLLAALAPLRERVQAAIDRFGPRRVAVVLGVSTAGLDEGLAAIRQARAGQGWPAGYDYALQEMGNGADCVARELGISGPAYVISTACSSGAKAIATGARLLRSGQVDAVVAGGGDALSGFTIAGFSALDAVSAERCNPLSAHRAGINLGEGAAPLVAARAPSAGLARKPPAPISFVCASMREFSRLMNLQGVQQHVFENHRRRVDTGENAQNPIDSNARSRPGSSS